MCPSEMEMHIEFNLVPLGWNKKVSPREILIPDVTRF